MTFVFGPFRFDARNLRLDGADGEIAVRPMTARLLHELLKDAPNLIGHEQLLDRVWGRQAVTPGVLSQSILELRRALGDSAQTPLYIETRHRLGYRFVAAIEVVGDDEGDAAAASNGEITPTPLPRQPVWRAPGAIIAAAVVGLCLVALGAWWTTRDDSFAPQGALYGIERLHDGRPREPQALQWYREGLLALERHDEGTARERFEQSLRREPTAVATQAALADALARIGERRKALELARSAVQGAGALPRVEQLRMQAFEAELDHRLDESIEHWQAVFGLDPGHADAGFRLAVAQTLAGHGLAAERTLDALEKLGPALADPSRLALQRARVAAMRGDQATRIAQAELAQAAARSGPQRIDAWLERAWGLTLTAQPEPAEAVLARLDEALAGQAQASLAARRDMLRATFARVGGRFDEALEGFAAIATSADARGDRSTAALARREAGFVLTLAGRPGEALAMLEPLPAEFAALGDPRAEAGALNVTGLAHQQAGNLAEAQALGERALTLFLGVGDRLGEAAARNQLGMLFARSGRLGEAEEHWQRALDAFAQVGDRRGAAVARGNLSSVYSRQGRTAAAREATEQALADFRAIDSRLDIARLQFNLGLQDRNAGALASAETRMREALDGFTHMQAEDFRLQALATLADLLLVRADLAGAAALLDAAPIPAQAPPQRRAAVLSARARLSALRGEYESAKAGFTEALRLRLDAGLTEWSLMSELDLTEVLAREGRLREAEEQARLLRRKLAELGDAPAALQAGALLAAILVAREANEPASRLLDELEADLARHPNALVALRIDLLRAALPATGRSEALERLASRAREAGYEWLALRAGALAGGPAANHALAALDRLGVPPGPARTFMHY